MAESCWPRYGGVIVFIVQLIELFLLASLYLVLCGSLMHGVLPGTGIPPRVWMAIAACIGLPTLFIKHLSHVAWVSLLGVIALTIAIIIVLGYGISLSTHWDLTTIALWDTQGIPIALAIVIFSYICHPILPTVEGNMREPDKFNIMLAVTYIFVAIIKILFALFGFLSFNTNIREVITNSIPLRSIQITVNLFLLLNVFFSYPFRVITIIRCIEESVDIESFPIPDRAKGLLWYISIRVVVNFLALLPAVAIPHFALMMSFIASFTGMLVVFVLPCIFHLKLQAGELQWYNRVVDYMVIVFGVFAGILGLIVSGGDLIQAF